MTECDNAEMRDLLPDLVNDLLSVGERDRVQAHVVSCDACSDEVVLLRAMRAARPLAPVVDVARIVSALPRNGRVDVDVADARVGPPLLTVSRSDVRPVVRRRGVFSGVWRTAATLAVAAIGGWSVLSYQRAQGTIDVTGQVAAPVAAGAAPQSDALPDTIMRMPGAAGGQVALADTPRATGGVPSTPDAGARSTRQTALSLGDLSDYSDDDLQRMLDRLDKWDGTTSAEPVPTVPIVPVSERGAR